MKMNLKIRTVLPVLTILFLTLSGLAVFNYLSQVSQLNAQEEEALSSALNTGRTMVENNLSLYQQMATLVAEMPSIAETFSRGDRKKLTGEFSRGFSRLRDEFKVAQFQFHTPPAFSFLRIHQPDKFGDDLSPFRNTVLSVNQTKRGVRGVEIGRAGLGLRGVEPVSFKGRHIGSVEFGGDLPPVLENIRQAFGVEVGVALSRQSAEIVFPDWQSKTKPVGNYIPYFSTQAKLTEGALNAGLFQAAETARREQAIFDEAAVGVRTYSIAVSPLMDYAGQKIGFLYILKDRTETLSKIRRTLLVNLAVYVTILVIVSLAIGLAITKNVIDPVIGLTRTADAISMGKLTEKVDVPGAKDEIATLAKSIDRMRVSMKKLLE